MTGGVKPVEEKDPALQGANNKTKKTLRC